MQAEINHFLDTLDHSQNTIDAYRYGLQRFVYIVGEDAPLNAETFETFLVAIKDYSPSTNQIWRSAVLGLYTFCKSSDLAEIQGLCPALCPPTAKTDRQFRSRRHRKSHRVLQSSQR